MNQNTFTITELAEIIYKIDKDSLVFQSKYTELKRLHDSIIDAVFKLYVDVESMDIQFIEECKGDYDEYIERGFLDREYLDDEGVENDIRNRFEEYFKSNIGKDNYIEVLKTILNDDKLRGVLTETELEKLFKDDSAETGKELVHRILSLILKCSDKKGESFMIEKFKLSYKINNEIESIKNALEKLKEKSVEIVADKNKLYSDVKSIEMVQILRAYTDELNSIMESFKSEVDSAMGQLIQRLEEIK